MAMVDGVASSCYVTSKRAGMIAVECKVPLATRENLSGSNPNVSGKLTLKLSYTGKAVSLLPRQMDTVYWSVLFAGY